MRLFGLAETQDWDHAAEKKYIEKVMIPRGVLIETPVEKEIDWCRTCDHQAHPSDSGVDWWTPGCKAAGEDVVRVALVERYW